MTGQCLVLDVLCQHGELTLGSANGSVTSEHIIVAPQVAGDHFSSTLKIMITRAMDDAGVGLDSISEAIPAVFLLLGVDGAPTNILTDHVIFEEAPEQVIPLESVCFMHGLCKGCGDHLNDCGLNIVTSSFSMTKLLHIGTNFITFASACISLVDSDNFDWEPEVEPRQEDLDRHKALVQLAFPDLDKFPCIPPPP
jgi:hypothetical protein